jgi:hypothetical protein
MENIQVIGFHPGSERLPLGLRVDSFVDRQNEESRQ